MLKTRVIGVVLVKAGIAVQSIGFQRYLPIGKPEIAINYLDRWGIDEIIVLHLDATTTKESPAAEQVQSYAQQCQVPLSIGGGISHVFDITRVIQAGADKVVINAALLTAPEMITQAAALFGSQCIVVSIDARRQADGTFLAFTHSGTQPTGLRVEELAQQAESLGAGEIFINSIDQDGAKNGYDLELISSLVQAVNIPVIACGGAGGPEHMQAVMRYDVSGIAAGNFFHFTEHSVIVVKQALTSAGQAVRLDSYATYQDFGIDTAGRATKQDDEVLEALRFHYIPEEVI